MKNIKGIDLEGKYYMWDYVHVTPTLNWVMPADYDKKIDRLAHVSLFSYISIYVFIFQMTAVNSDIHGIMNCDYLAGIGTWNISAIQINAVF